jgi:D-alanyl-D-alanine carboxypeptidase/D-alanyl-D-alanine-endopeptidase (penicillin-binding protein 4)
MRVLCLVALLLAGLSLPPTRLLAKSDSATPPALSWAELPGALQAVVKATRAPGSTWGVVVAHADSGKLWYATNPTQLFVPASNSKLFSVALALDRFGPTHTFQNHLTLAGTIGPDGSASGPLWLQGQGAPPRISTSSPPPLEAVARQLHQQGLRRLPAGLVLGAPWLRTAPYGSGWNWDDLQEAYGAPVGDYVWNDNAVRVQVVAGAAPGEAPRVTVDATPSPFDLVVTARTGPAKQPTRLRFHRLPGEARLSVSGVIAAGSRTAERLAVPDAPRAYAQALQAALTRQGIQCDGPLRMAGPDEPVPSGTKLELKSAPLGEVAADCLKPSNNLLAHLLLLQVGADSRLHPRTGEAGWEGDDESRGIAAMDAFLRPLGITGKDATFEEGSGLSRKNLVTPAATVRLLQHVRRQSWGGIYREALPVGGIDGTLASRFKEGPARGNVRAKTGTLRHVHALAGYLNTAGGQPLVFAIYVNGFQTDADGPAARTEMDRLVELLARFPGQGPE